MYVIDVDDGRERSVLNLPTQAAFIDDDRTEAAHDAITKVIFCKVLFDLEPTQIWGHPEFEAFKLGYNIQVKYGQPDSRRFLSVSCRTYYQLRLLSYQSCGSSSSEMRCCRSSHACTVPAQ